MRTTIKEMNKRLDEREQVIEQLRIDNQELLEDNAWWQRRFNAVQRDYENLQQRMKKKVYLSNIEWEKVSDNKGGVKATIVFNDLMTYEESNKLLNSIYFLLEILGDEENE